MEWITEQWHQVRGNAKWDLSKWIGAIVLGGAYFVLQRIRHLPTDWWVAGGLLGFSFVWFLIVSRDAKRGAKRDEAAPTLSAPSERSWLEQLADEDAAKITERVSIAGQYTVFHFEPGSDPYIQIVWTLFNALVFKVVTWG